MDMLNEKLRFGKRVWVMVFYHRPEGAAEKVENHVAAA
jgi:hypothetical protein